MRRHPSARPVLRPLAVLAALLAALLSLSVATAPSGSARERGFYVEIGPYPPSAAMYGGVTFLQDTRAFDAGFMLNDNARDGLDVAGYFVVKFKGGGSRNTSVTRIWSGAETDEHFDRGYLFQGRRIASVRPVVCLFVEGSSSFRSCAYGKVVDNPRT